MYDRDENSEYISSYDDIPNKYEYEIPKETYGSGYQNSEFVDSYDDISNAYSYTNPEFVRSYDDILNAYKYDNPEFIGSYDDVPTAGDTVPKTDYIESLVAAVKSGALSSEALKNLPGSVQAAVTKSLTAPSLLDKVGNF